MEFFAFVEQFDFIFFKIFDLGFCIIDFVDFGDENVRFIISKGGVYSNVIYEFKRVRKVRVEVVYYGL